MGRLADKVFLANEITMMFFRRLSIEAVKRVKLHVCSNRNTLKRQFVVFWLNGFQLTSVCSCVDRGRLLREIARVVRDRRHYMTF